MKNEPMLWNTLEEAAAWLSQTRGDTWTAKKVIDAALRAHKQDARHPRPTLISAVLPHGCEYGIYVWDAPKGSPENPFVPKHPWALPVTEPIPLYQAHLGDILLRGKFEISMLQSPESPDGIEGEYRFIEPLGRSIEITMGMLGISGRKLRALAKLLPDAKRTEAETGPVSAESTDEQIIAAWPTLSPDQRQKIAIALVRRNEGNHAAAARVVGVSPRWMIELAKRAREAEADRESERKSKKRILPIAQEQGPYGLPKPKPRKASS